MNVWERFVNFRRMEYYDSIQRDENSGAWEALGAYLATQAVHSGGKERAVTVTLTRHWATIPTLVEERWMLPAGPYLDFSGSYVFHTWTTASEE